MSDKTSVAQSPDIQSLFGYMQGTVEIEGDIVAPTGEDGAQRPGTRTASMKSRQHLGSCRHFNRSRG
jgi:hypothetical protein